jgi:hypothetical protein
MHEVDAWRYDAIQVPYSMSQLRFWRNTPNVSTLAPGATWTLTQNILGVEWDASPDNGFAPRGLIDLSSTTLSVNTYLLDYGTTDGNGTATHNLTLYRDPRSGALVFGAGTESWSFGLSDEHDGAPTPTDPDIQQAMVNLLADMGVQPGSLQSGLIAAVKSTDATPPTSSISTPANGASFVEGQPLTFSGVANDSGGQVAGVELSVDGGTTWFRASGTTNWTYTWNAVAGTHTIMSRATDDSLNTETPRPGISVTVTARSNLFGSTAVPDSETASDLNSAELGVKFSSSSSGTITGMRFWKNSINTGGGTHSASLWSATGNLLASATFANETASGWQEVLFPQPVQITAGTTYVASYHTYDGAYSGVVGYFGTPLSNGPLTAPVNAGVYAYSSSPVFPSNTYLSANYWVDVLFAANAAGVPPAITSPLTASGAVGAAFSYQITANNNPTSFNATGLPAGLAINTATGLISGTPNAAGNSNVTLSATNSAGTGSATLALSITASGSTVTLFRPSDTPSIVTVNDSGASILGVKFQALTNGKITGIRFYKGPKNTGTHIGSLWTSGGQLLGTATFANETASGWQQVNFSSPIIITANTTYIASYHTNVGYYSATAPYFTTSHTNGPLTAPSSASVGGNGVYAYNGSNVFPNSTYNADNYFVDVVFVQQ